jgi:simple sugar transport system ATP-binding protein
VLDLPLGLRQRTEVIKALASNAKVLLLDEPSSVLTDDEKKTLFSDLRSTCDEGVAILIATHKLQDVIDFCDKVTVMKLGHVVLEKECGQGSVHELASAMVGGQFGGSFAKEQTKELGETVLKADNLTVSDDRGKVTVKNVSFVVRKGEILGIIGVAGNGQVELAEALSGLRKPMSGEVRVCEHNLYGREGGEHLIGHITDDPAKVGLALNMTVRDNFVCNILDKFAHHAIMQDDRMAEFAEGAIKKFGVVARSLVVPLRYLSGGNIQKVIAAREIMKNPEVLIAEHPTRGLDISATSLVLRELAELALQGSALVLIAEDVDEVLAVSDRIGVIFEGEILRMDTKQNLDKAMIGGLMGGIRIEGSISGPRT